MPGNADSIGNGWVQGWARHPVHAGYPMTVHALNGGRIVATVLANLLRGDGMPGFDLPIDPTQDPGRLRVLIGETDEYLPLPGAVPPRRIWTVEDLIDTPIRRAWVDGACWIDGAEAGLTNETIIDLLCRDYLGHPASPMLVASLAAALPERGHDGVRALLIESHEYKLRRIYADQAPGAIFSQKLILRAAAGDAGATEQAERRLIRVSGARLLELDGADFVTACYRQILRKQTDAGGLAHYVGELAKGIAKADIVRHLATDLEAINAGIIVVDLPPS